MAKDERIYLATLAIKLAIQSFPISVNPGLRSTLLLNRSVTPNIVIDSTKIRDPPK